MIFHALSDELCGNFLKVIVINHRGTHTSTLVENIFKAVLE